jgi:hypothetical protein
MKSSRITGHLPEKTRFGKQKSPDMSGYFVLSPFVHSFLTTFLTIRGQLYS